MEAVNDEIKVLVESILRYTTREIAETLNTSYVTIQNHFKKLKFEIKHDVWVPHKLKKTHLVQCLIICDMLLKREENDTFLKRMFTGDEKWIVYDNVERERSWGKRGEPPKSTPKVSVCQRC